MKKTVLFILMLGNLSAFGQEVLFLKDPAIDSIVPHWGPNRRHYIHPYIAIGMAIDGGEQGGRIRQPHFFDETRFGFRYKRRLNGVFSLGGDLLYNVQNYSLRQDSLKILPDTLLYKKQRMLFHQLRGAVFIRINYDKRGNRLGNYIDLGAYGDFNFAHIMYTRIKNADNTLTRAKTSRLKYFNPLGYGLHARVGFNLFSCYVQYRLSDFFYPSKHLPELPRLTAGVEFFLKK
ncbi:MAG: hypothetical protein IT240_06750 [Bacteroidia bacterium]|jgi:hypothetical protein|nr:hypothetical protein [Bacteroidia bacterium]MCC6768725.1 hypothetical protein [Bacteroidia bacterium]